MRTAQEKIVTLDQLLEHIANHKHNRERVVFTNGCFDLLHRGHVTYLESARTCGDILIVGVNSRRSLERLKGNTRVLVNPDTHDRMSVLAALESVDYVIDFEEDTPLELISAITPDVLIKGGDWSPENIVGADIVTAKGGEVKTIPYLEGYSTTRIVQSIQGRPA